MNTNRTYRLYGFVPYNLSPIQQGIQFGHAVQEYNNLMLDCNVSKKSRDAFYQWRRGDKTFIILNGGTTNSRRFDGKYVGSLNQHKEDLSKAGIAFADFHEPDLGDQLTAFVFLVDDRVFDRETWPDYDGVYFTNGQPAAHPYHEWKMKFDVDETVADQIVWLRTWLKNFRLA